MLATLLLATALLYMASLARADASSSPAVSNLYISNAQTSFSINLPPDSNDVNFAVSSPTWYSYFAVGFGSSMAGSLMLVVYSAADSQHITVSPRLGTGDSEPPYYPRASISLADGSSIQNSSFVVSGTCKGCRTWPGGSLDTNTTTQPFIFAFGPNIGLASDDVATGLRRHIGYGHFTMNTIHATGPGGVATLTAVDDTITTGAAMTGDIHDDTDKKALAHGLVMALATLALAPVDVLAASALRRWPVLHMLTSAALVIMTCIGLGLGVAISGEYLASQGFRSPHQVLGFVSIAIIVVLLALGVVSHISKIAAARRGEDRNKSGQVLIWIHTWGGRLLWLTLLVNGGLGLQFAAAKTTFIVGYAVLAVGVCIAVGLVQLFIYCCLRERSPKHEEEDAGHQLASMYDH